MTVAPPAPIVVNRAAYLAMVQAAQKAARNPADLPALLGVIQVLEAERDLLEWSVADQETLEAIRQGPRGVVGDERGYYPLHARGHAQPLPGEAPRRTLWRGSQGQPDIVVLDQPPIPAERVHRLLQKGALRPNDAWSQHGSPFRAFALRRRNSVDKPGWSSVAGAKGEGAWLHSGTGRTVAWIPLAQDAQYLADCVNAVMRLGRDVARELPPTPAFPGHLERTGLMGLMHALVDSLEPADRWASPAPAALRAVAERVDRDLCRLLDHVAACRPERVGDASQLRSVARH